MFRKNSQIPSFMKIRPVVPEMFQRTDGRKNTTKLKVTFRNFMHAIINGSTANGEQTAVRTRNSADFVVYISMVTFVCDMTMY
jgi:hypothetical protein